VNLENNPRLLVHFFRQAWPVYALSLTLHFIANLIHVYYPRVLGQFADKLQLGELTRSLVLDYSLLLLLIGIGHVVFSGTAMYLVMYVGRRFESILRGKLFRHFTGMSERFYSSNGVGKLLSYFMNDVSAVRESIAMGFNATSNAVMLFAAALVMMITSGIPLYLIAACIAPMLIIPFIVVKLGPVIRTRSREVQESLGAMTDMAEEQFGGIRVTKKFAVEPIMKGRFGRAVDQITANQLRLVKVSSFFQALIPLLGTLALVIALALGGYLAINGGLSLGSFVALTLYVRMLMNPLQQIGNVVNSIQRSRASLQRLNELLSQGPDIVETEGAVTVDLAKADITFNHLTFAYQPEGRPVLKNIQLSVAAGTTLGIVGKTGSGKTTLMKLLLRTYDPPPGSIAYGGVDVRDMALENLREGIAYVPQDGFLFSTTIGDNIAFYRRDAESERVEEAARQASIFQQITELPDRFQSKLGERGLTLSGGQRQRTSLARGLIKKAPIMILDDSVSAVDAVTERKILSSIAKERKGKTTIIIAHRISAVKHADQIIVLDEGAIVQQGTHDELLSKDGFYRELYAIQEGGMRHGSQMGERRET
jgi:ATP-binding cassette, subfamily B, multidrug efflux pump